MNFNLFFHFLICDAPEAYQLGMQDPATISAEWLANLHDTIMIDLLVVVGVIFFLLYYVITTFSKTANPTSDVLFSHSKYLEIFWTVVPALVLLSIASPTFSLLYTLDDAGYSRDTFLVKVIGHQWYWSYEVEKADPFFGKKTTDVFAFNSYMVDTADLAPGRLRLLDTDTHLHLPIKRPIRLLITSSDVLHSWTIPSFGVKVDACPGRITTASFFIKRAGLYFGQCSELCGVNHGFMPIVVNAIQCQYPWRNTL